jgi:hypothetical protein
VQCSDEPLHEPSALPKLHITKKVDAPSKKKKQKGICIMPRFVLKRKQNSGHPYPEISAKLKLNGYRLEKLPAQEQIDYMNFISFNHFIDVQHQFSINPHKRYDGAGIDKSKWYITANLILRQCLVKIIETDNELQWSFADSIIALWNKTIKPYKGVFRRVNLNNKESKAYINAVIAISHCLVFRVGGSMEQMRTAVLRLPQGRFKRRPPWNWKNSVTIDKFFMLEFFTRDKMITHNPYLDNEVEFSRFVNSYKQNKKNIKAFDYFKKDYINEFFPNNVEEGEKACYLLEFAIKEFLDDLIDEIRRGANTYNFSLVLDKKERASLLKLYFHYLGGTEKYQFSAARFKKILNMDTWMDFVNKYMRIEMGYEDFWRKESKKTNGRKK